MKQSGVSDGEEIGELCIVEVMKLDDREKENAPDFRSV